MYGPNPRRSLRTPAPNRPRATPRPNMEPETATSPRWSRRPRWAPNCPPRPPDQPHTSINGSTMKTVDARATSVRAADPRDARNQPLHGSRSHKHEHSETNPPLYDEQCQDTPHIQWRGQLAAKRPSQSQQRATIARKQPHPKSGPRGKKTHKSPPLLGLSTSPNKLFTSSQQTLNGSQKWSRTPKLGPQKP